MSAGQLGRAAAARRAYRARAGGAARRAAGGAGRRAATLKVAAPSAGRLAIATPAMMGTSVAYVARPANMRIK